MRVCILLLLLVLVATVAATNEDQFTDGGADGDHGVVRAPLFGAHITAIVTMRHTAPSAAVNSKEKMARQSLDSLHLVLGQGLSLFGPD
ncbi:hypothetical protein BSKO_13449 [Bryopsis sp. KO-2023]|nr:hypothetical protein BSKO_13449 [Bryopsis sp. KO-2023]